ncbi:MAG: response regulator [Candidatus Cloacimonetes bacterium]|nr:response regulator [Candidatus Cloacimonadota bacterium]
MKILVVEDDFVCRKLLHKILQPFGECDIAVNGREAMDVVRAGLDASAPYDLICLDIMMPDMDGLTALEEIRSLEKERGIDLGEGAKIIMVTALSDNRHILQSFRFGCESYIVKPVRREKLLQEMMKLSLLPEGTV